MDLAYFLQGLVIGFSIAAPVGPIGILCIQRTLSQGRVSGLVTGLGAATADAVYGSIAGFGLTFISILLISSLFWLRLLGGIFLCYLGLKTFFSKPMEQKELRNFTSLGKAYTSTLFLTLTNPTTILSFTAVFAGLGVVGTHANYFSSSIMVLGVFLGSTLWWIILSTGISFLKSKFRFSSIHWINYLSGIIILLFGLFAFMSLIRIKSMF